MQLPAILLPFSLCYRFVWLLFFRLCSVSSQFLIFVFTKECASAYPKKKMVRNERFNLFWFQIEANKNRTRAAKCVCCMLFAVLYFRFNVLFRMTKYRAKD